MLKRRILMTLWPSFLAACALELVVFAVVDPRELHWFWQTIEWTVTGVCTLAFFVFWTISFAATALALWLTGSEANLPTA